jgi:amidase
MSAVDLWSALDQSVQAAHKLWQVFDRIDVLLTPMLATAPPALGSFPMDHRDCATQIERMDAFAPFAALANVTGAPALTLPVGADAQGLPLPVQLIGPMGSDLQLLGLGATIEAAGQWHHPIAMFGAPS